MFEDLSASVCTKPRAEHPSLAEPYAGIRCNSAQRNRTTQRRLGEGANFRSYFLLHFFILSDSCLQIIQYYVIKVSSLYWHLCFALLGQHLWIFQDGLWELTLSTAHTWEAAWPFCLLTWGAVLRRSGQVLERLFEGQNYLTKQL